MVRDLLFERPGRDVPHAFFRRLSHQDFGADRGPKGSGRNPPSRASRNAFRPPDCIAAMSSARSALYEACAMLENGTFDFTLGAISYGDLQQRFG